MKELQGLSVKNSIELGVQKLFGIIGLVVIRRATYERLRQVESENRPNALFRYFSSVLPDFSYFEELLRLASSQLLQDVVALLISGRKTNGFFVEFGATDGITLSNTYMLEKHFGWTGILAEPGRSWFEALEANRSAKISKNAVYSHSGLKQSFVESGERSTLEAFSQPNNVSYEIKYEVTTISLQDLLESFNAPHHIDFLSIDTEGSEYSILENFDFASYSFGFICVEHNGSRSREYVELLLKKAGYSKILSHLSMWDDWFVPDETKKKFEAAG